MGIKDLVGRGNKADKTEDDVDLKAQNEPDEDDNEMEDKDDKKAEDNKAEGDDTGVEASDDKEAAKAEGDDDDPDDDGGAAAQAQPEDVVRMCNDAGVSALAVTLVKESLTAEQVTDRIESALETKKIVNMARVFNPAIDTALADDFIAAGASIQHVKAELLDKVLSMKSPDISNAHSPDARSAGEQVDHGWGAVIEKHFGPKEA